jgi:hypothetical protein
MLSIACALPGSNKLEVPRNAPFLALGSRRADSLVCEGGRCAKWYRFAIYESKRVSIQVSADLNSVAADFGVTLFGSELEFVAKDRAPYQRPRDRGPRQVSAQLDSGLYYLRVENLIDLDAPLHYQIRAIAGPLTRFDRSVPPTPEDRPAETPANGPTPSQAIPSVPKPEPVRPAPRPADRTPPKLPSRLSTTTPTTPTTPSTPSTPAQPSPPPMPPGTAIRTDVIEVERAAGVPVAVLIDAGTRTGVSAGQTGRLVVADREIGRIEIVDVYAAGSRAKIVGELSGEITPDAAVEVFDFSD